MQWPRDCNCQLAGIRKQTKTLTKRAGERYSNKHSNCCYANGSDGNSEGSSDAANDADALEQELKRKEKEAQELREKLRKQSSEAKQQSESEETVPEGTSTRSGDPFGRQLSGRSAREQLFSRSLPSSDWLADGGSYMQETETLSGSSADETVGSDVDAIVRRRLIVGLGITAVTTYLALQPDTAPPPKRPPAYFAASLMQGRDALDSTADALAKADWETASQLLQASNRYLTSDVLDGAASSLSETTSAKKARELAQAVREDLEASDFEQYFKLLSVDGARQDYYAQFTSKSAKDGVYKIDAILELFPDEALSAARQQPAF